jgi:hypothetical protein
MARFTRMLVVVCGIVGATARAQYYDPREEAPPAEARFVYGGAMWREFSPLPANSLPDSAAIRFTRVMPLVGFRAGLVDMYFGYTTYMNGGQSRSAIVFGGTVGGEYVALGGRPGALLVQLMLAADFTKVESGGPQREDFNVASVGLGMGLEYRYRARTMLFWVRAGVIAQYATEGFSTGSGFSPAVAAESMLCLRGIGPFDGIALGYRFRLQTWSMSNAALDYRSVFHGPTLGVMF